MLEDDIDEFSVEPVQAAIPLVPYILHPHGGRTSFADYKNDARAWITLITGEYYPDILVHACQLYEPVLRQFAFLLTGAESSARLLLDIAEIRSSWMRIQLARVFRKYVSPETPVEMLKQKNKAKRIAEDFSLTFRAINEVHLAFDSRPIPDEPLCALLWEYKDRGKKGYDLTEKFFQLFREAFPHLTLAGPERAGKDIRLSTIFPNYPNPNRPIDFLIRENDDILAVGLARYDGDRGGAQEDDRTGGYKNCSDEILSYCGAVGLTKVKVIFINDGPGLLLGSMWDDYAAIEARAPTHIRIMTLRMLTDRLTDSWLRS